MIFLLVMLFADIRSQYLCCTPVVLTWQPIPPAAHAHNFAACTLPIAGEFEYIFLDPV